MAKKKFPVQLDTIATTNQQSFGHTQDGKRKKWSILRLIENAKDLPVQKMPMSGLNIVNLHPIPENMIDFVRHILTVKKANLKYPIILDDEGYIMDGRHRVAKALLMGKKTIKFVRFNQTPDPDCEEDI